MPMEQPEDPAKQGLQITREDLRVVWNSDFVQVVWRLVRTAIVLRLILFLDSYLADLVKHELEGGNQKQTHEFIANLVDLLEQGVAALTFAMFIIYNVGSVLHFFGFQFPVVGRYLDRMFVHTDRGRDQSGHLAGEQGMVHAAGNQEHRT